MTVQQRVAYFNGNIVPEDQVAISFRDRGFLLGDAVFDSSRTFAGKLFRLDEHVDRLFKSLHATGIQPTETATDIIKISREVLARNVELLAAGDDYWVSQRITRGENVVGGELWQSTSPTVIVECTPIPFAARAALFQQGIDVWVPSVRRIPPECLSPNIKSHNYLNLVLADQEIRHHGPNAWAILLDSRGFLTEGIGSNLFLVRDGCLLTPRRQFVLAGITRQTVIELAERMGIAVIEEDLSPNDLIIADEAFVTSTSFCLCPVRNGNGHAIGDAAIPGPVTARVGEAFSELVGFDFRGQYLKHLQ